jgi:alkylhydroperoxidase family enzyme
MAMTPGEQQQLPDDVRTRLGSLPPISIYQLLAPVGGALIPWTDLVGALYGLALDPRLREIAICRQARTARAVYELHQHRLIAGNNGVSDEDLETILRDPVVDTLDPEANLVCRAADELELTATLSDDTRRQLIEVLGPDRTTELILVVGFYCAVARFTNATRAPIEPDNPLAGASNPNG